MRRYVLRAAQLPELAVRFSLPDEARLMWVTKAMSRLAVEYADSIPDCDWTAIQPARHGIVVWEGGTGQECVGADGRAQIVRGVAWSDDPVVGMTFKALSDPPERSAFPLTGTTQAMILDQLRASGLWRLLATTLVLAETPTVARQRRQPAYRPTGSGRPPHVHEITTVLVREALDTGAQPERAGGEDRKWKLTHRHLVRGHWRAQACGPKRAERKPTFVPPYIKGPEGAPIRQTSRVHIWQR